MFLRLSTFIEKKVRHHKCRKLNLECAKLITIHVHDRMTEAANSKRFSMKHLRTKASRNKKEIYKSLIASAWCMNQGLFGGKHQKISQRILLVCHKLDTIFETKQSFNYLTGKFFLSQKEKLTCLSATLWQFVTSFFPPSNFLWVDRQTMHLFTKS